jgi:hypothetical protein
MNHFFIFNESLIHQDAFIVISFRETPQAHSKIPDYVSSVEQEIYICYLNEILNGLSTGKIKPRLQYFYLIFLPFSGRF